MQSDMKTPLLSGGACSSGGGGSDSELPAGHVIGILGSGDFSRSLAVRLVASGLRAVVGSRDPNRAARRLFPEGAELRSQREAAAQAERLVFVAVHPEHYGSLLGLREPLAGKVLVDVSNASETKREGSNAERLAAIFPRSRVVKGFNLISAWALQAGAHDGSRQVLVCSDCPDSKAAVVQLAHLLGFSPVDRGGLCSSREVEEASLLLFPSWRGPILLTVLLFLFFYGYIFIRSVLLPYLDHGENNFHHLPLVTVNQALPAVALVTLALVYLPGVMAAALQLHRGTKYRRFPGWLDRWLCRRKQLGLLSFLSASLHAVYSLCLTLRKPAGAALQAKGGASEFGAGPMVWRADLYLSCGVLGLGVLALLAVASLPSVGNNLSWREFTFVQSGLGYAALTLSTSHTLFFGWDFTFLPLAFPFYLPPVYLLALILPCTVLVSRTLLALPCLTRRLAKIRRGWERTSDPGSGPPPRACGDV